MDSVRGQSWLSDMIEYFNTMGSTVGPETHNLLNTSVLFHHGSHIFGQTNFPDFSLTIPVIFFHFPVFYRCFYKMNLTNRKIYLTEVIQLKKSEKNNKN